MPEATAVVIGSHFNSICSADHQFLFASVLIVDDKVTFDDLLICHLHEVTALLVFGEKE